MYGIQRAWIRETLSHKKIPPSNKQKAFWVGDISVGAERVQAQEKEGFLCVCFLFVMLWMEPSAEVCLLNSVPLNRIASHSPSHKR